MQDSKNFIAGYIAAVLAFVLLLLGATEYFLRNVADPAHPNLVKARLLRDRPTADAIVGSSQTGNDLTGAPGFSNISIMAQPASTFLQVGRHYFADKAPGRIILQVAPFEFNSRQATPYKGDMVAELLRPQSKLRVLDPMYSVNLSGMWNNMFFHRKGWTMEVRPDGSELWTAHFNDVPHALRQIKLSALIKLEVPDMEPAGSPPDRDFREFISRMKRGGADICLLTLPFTREFREGADSYPSFRQTLAYYDSLAREMGVRRANFYDTDIDYSYFSDHLHLNIEGAEKYTPIFVSGCFG